MIDNVEINNENIKFLKTYQYSKANDNNIIITIEDSEAITNNNCYNVSLEGKIIHSHNNFDSLSENELLKLKEELITLLQQMSFVKIPGNILLEEVKNIYNFTMENSIKENDLSRVYPVSVQMNSLGEIKTIKIILLLCGGKNNVFVLSKLPLKIVDANNRVVFSSLVDINETISPGTIKIWDYKFCYENLLDDLDLSSWDISFEL